MEGIWKVVKEFALTAGIRLVGAIVIVIAGFWLVNFFVKRTEKRKGIKGVDPGARTFIRSFVSVGLKVVIVLTAAALLGVPMTNVVTLLGTAGLAVGLALQGTLSNFCGGLMILIFKPFKVGDFIKTVDHSGTVKEITILYTVLTTVDNCRVVIPNGTVSNAVVTDFSAEPTRRLDLEFSVSYGADLDVAKKVLTDCARGHELILGDPAPAAYVKAHGESSVTLLLRAWAKTPDYWTAYFDLEETVKKEFDRAGVEIPFPQVDVHVK